jgi:flagellar protein FliS
MNPYEAARQYRQLSSRGAHPVGLVVRLYDALLEDFRRAGEAVRAGEIERRTAAINHALLILAELEGTLDHTRGGVVAKHLEGLYQVSRALLVEANLRNSVERLQELTGMFLPVRQAWQQAERELSASGASVAAERPLRTATEPIEADTVSSGSRSWSV